MGPQLHRCGKVRDAFLFFAAFSLLQWGRNFIVAESRCRAAGHSVPSRLQWGRNFIVAESASRRIARSISHRSFNGAATSSLRKGPFTATPMLLAVLLQWGRNFIVAESSTTGARARAGASASMGPQLHRCGKWQSTTAPASRTWCFNGAATSSLRKVVGLLPTRLHRTCFNGAATSSLRKVSCHAVASKLSMKLQWGRNFIVAESS